ncbi:hypothetical protein MASR2M78_18830 [Treponema sp.]
MKWFVLGLAVLMYAVVVVAPHKKSWASLSAALLLLISGVVPLKGAILYLVNWNVLLIYVGSLIIAELLSIQEFQPA